MRMLRPQAQVQHGVPESGTSPSLQRKVDDAATAAALVCPIRSAHVFVYPVRRFVIATASTCCRLHVKALPASASLIKSVEFAI